MSLPLRNKIAIVTGSSRGIGEAIAWELAVQGAKVMITYATPASAVRASSLSERIAALDNGSGSSSLQVDVRDPGAYQRIVDATLAAFSTQTIDILVNNAGIVEEKSMIDVSPATFDDIFFINVRAPFFLTQVVHKHLPSGGGGRIINISSLASRAGFGKFSVYSATKAALEGLTRSWASEFGPEGHTVNAVNPGPTQSDMIDQVAPEFIQMQIDQTPLKRLATGDDIAQIVCWLAGDGSRWITGQAFSASGGYQKY